MVCRVTANKVESPRQMDKLGSGNGRCWYPDVSTLHTAHAENNMVLKKIKIKKQILKKKLKPKTKSIVKTKKKKKKNIVDIITKSRITLKMENFCRYYLFGGYYKDEYFGIGNGTRSYALAYDYDIDDKKELSTCQSAAGENLMKPDIRFRMRELLQEEGFNDEIVDARSIDIIKNGSDKDANKAIDSYNKLVGRVQTDTNIVIINPNKKEIFNSAAVKYLENK